MTDIVWHGPEQLTSMLTPISELWQLKPNARRGNIPKIKASLNEFGQVELLLVATEVHPDSDGQPVTVIQHGNHRAQSGDQLGWTHMATLDVTHLTPNQRKALALAMNRTGDVATYDTDELILSFEALEDDPALLATTGWDEDSIDMMLGVTDWSAKPNEPVDPDPDDPGPVDTDDEETWWPMLSFRLPPDLLETWKTHVQSKGIEQHEALEEFLANIYD